jgi:succinyl-diaminopimelate desuccinylase
MTDPVPLLKRLIRCRSVTPEDDGALDVVAEVLAKQGFKVERLMFSETGTPDVKNLFARYGEGKPHLCFAGHTDVVPAGDEESWQYPPFAGVETNGAIYGRGASDMKGSIAAFMAAAIDFIGARGPQFKGSISLLLTGDEEGPAINGTAKVLTRLKQEGAVPDHCLVGEPTCIGQLGDALKVGRRGSLTVWVAAHGRQGHSAYPQFADNPIPKLVRLLDRLASHRLDQGTDRFEPSNLAITSVDVGNPATNVIPGKAFASINIRFNPLHNARSLADWIQAEVLAVEAEMGGKFELRFGEAADAFLTEAGPFVDMLRRAVEKVTGTAPQISTSGGTSDARFIKNYCPVVEFGPRGETIHQVDERIDLNDLLQLKRVYQTVAEDYFGPA